MASEKKAKTKEFTSKAGNKYTFQKVPPARWLDVMDTMDAGSGKKSRAAFYPEVLETVVVTPSGLKPDDFEDFSELDEVVTAAVMFQQG